MPTPVDKNVDKKKAAKPRLRCRSQGEMADWLAASGGSLAITTYTSGRLVLVSSINGRLRFRTHRFARPMGIALAGERLALAVRQQVLLFGLGSREKSTFRLQRCYETDRVDAHDVAFGRRGIYFANTRYNGLARVSQKKRFVHCWQPPFIDGVVRGDRCHLNGLGMHDGKPALATAFCATGDPGGWRAQDRLTGGVVLDVQQNEIVARGLCMPHSPRWHDGRWWLCNSGHGVLATLDPQSGECIEVCGLAGFTRGLCLVGKHALVGLSKIRRKHILDAPPVRERHKELSAGVALVDLTTGRQVGLLEFLDAGREVFDVVFLPNLVKPHLWFPKE